MSPVLAAACVRRVFTFLLLKHSTVIVLSCALSGRTFDTDDTVPKYTACRPQRTEHRPGLRRLSRQQTRPDQADKRLDMALRERSGALNTFYE